MGMYTEFHFNAELKKDTPASVLAVLAWMTTNGESERPELPDHPFFTYGRWECLFTMDSYYFDADTISTLRYDDISGTHYLCVRSNLKAGGEIDAFANWIAPYLDAHEGDFLGFQRYEETEWPTLLHYPNHWTPTAPPIIPGYQLPRQPLIRG